jgi:gas vesicle protein
MSTSNNRLAFGAFLCGVGLGLVTSLLLAPRSGEETRRLIGKRARDLRDTACDAADSVSEAVEDIRAQVTDAVTDAREQLSDTIRDVRTKLQEAVETGKEVYREDLKNTARA